MKGLNLNLISIALGVATIGALVYLVRSINLSSAAAGVAGAVGDVATGAVLGIGDQLGVPRTNLSACEKAKAEGRTLDASFACPAGSFLSYLWEGKPAAAKPVATSYDYGGGSTFPTRLGLNAGYQPSPFIPDYLRKLQ